MAPRDRLAFRRRVDRRYGNGTGGRRIDHQAHPTGSAAEAIRDERVRSRRRPRRRSPRDGPGRAPRARSGRSCRRGPPGSAARGGRDRRGPRGGSPAAGRSPPGRPSPRGSSVPCTGRRRRGRPCAVDPGGQLRALDDRLLRDHREVVAVERDVQSADRARPRPRARRSRRRCAGRAERRGAGSR